MAYSDTFIIVHLIGNVSGDDTITIRKNFDTNDFHITYRDQNNGSPLSHEVTGLYHARVIDYVYTLFKNQSLDEEGYRSVQLSLPALPRIIVSGDKFKQLYYREHFLEAIGTGLNLLENTEAVKVPKLSRRSSTPVTQYATEYSYSTPAHRSTAPGVRPEHLYFD